MRDFLRKRGYGSLLPLAVLAAAFALAASGTAGAGAPETPRALYPINGESIEMGEVTTVRATEFSATDGSTQTGSEWRFLPLSNGASSLERTLNEPGNTFKLEATRSGIHYEWQVRYVYKDPGGTTRTTAWSSWATFAVSRGRELNGCDAGYGVLSVLTAAAFFAIPALRRVKAGRPR